MTDLRKGQVRLGPRTWAVIREAYLAGASGASLAKAYGCSLGTIRYRAVREGWRRCDVADGAGEPPAAGVEADDAEPPSLEALAEAARGAAMRAVLAGRPADAAAYIRVAEAAGRLSMAEADDGPMQEALAARDREDRTLEYEAEIQRRLSLMQPEQRGRTLAMIREEYPEFIYTGPL